ncbi:MAG: hypothetical protein WA890_15330, partial [Micromonospora sp.]
GLFPSARPGSPPPTRSSAMVERRTGPTPQPSLRNCTGRIPDGHTVKRPRHATRQPLSIEQMLPGLTVAGMVLVLLVLGVLRTAGVLS